MIFGEQVDRDGMRPFSTEIIRSVAVSATIWFSLTAITAQTPAARIASTANHFLSTLNEKQRQTVLYAFDDEQRRPRCIVADESLLLQSLPVVYSRGNVSIGRSVITSLRASPGLESGNLLPTIYAAERSYPSIPDLSGYAKKP